MHKARAESGEQSQQSPEGEKKDESKA